MNTWVEKKFEETFLVPVRNGIYKSKEFHGSGCKIINMGELFEHNFISNQEMKRLDLTVQELEKTSIRDGDLLFGRRSLVEAGAGKHSVVMDPKEPTVFESSIIRVRLDKGKANPLFFYYYFYSPEGRGRIASIVTGTNVKGIKGSDLAKILVQYPSKDTQDSIASALYAYDHLILINTQKIASLEEMAQRLYTEWFVYFKFPGHESEKMVDSGTKLGKIPEGWRVVNIEALLDSVKRKKKFKTSEYQEKGVYPIVDQGSDFFGGYTDDAEAVYKETLIVFGDHSRCFKYCNFYFACGADGTQLLKSNDMERMPQSLFYFSVKNAGLTDYKYARHFKFLKVLPILLPNKEVSGAFASIIDKNFDLIQNLSLQNKVLSEMRDLLIPQLMTGKRELK